MKVVLFCGGQGMRLRGQTQDIPKPMVEIGYRPILWHVMKYYAYYGHVDFILCLGYRSDHIKNYFINYKEYLSNDFVLRNGGEKIELLNTDIHDWNITFVDTGFDSPIGERLRQVRDHLEGEEIFLANYSDNLTDFHLPEMVKRLESTDNVVGFLCVKPPLSFHIVSVGESGRVDAVQEINSSDLWVNGGYFVLRHEVFDYLREGEELVLQPFSRLIKDKKLMAVRYDGFWRCMDTFKDKAALDDMFERGSAPWRIWDPHSSTRRSRT